jgi:hypothetical protein
MRESCSEHFCIKGANNCSILNVFVFTDYFCLLYCNHFISVRSADRPSRHLSLFKCLKSVHCISCHLLAVSAADALDLCRQAGNFSGDSEFCLCNRRKK